MRVPVLTQDDVRRIRSDGLSDAYWERLLGVTRTCVRKARVGITWQTHSTPPDDKPRAKGRILSIPRMERPEPQRPPTLSDKDRQISLALRRWARVEAPCGEARLGMSGPGGARGQ